MLTFKLVVNGDIVPGHEQDEVKARIAALFNLQDKPQQLAALFAGQAVTVKSGLSEQQAQIYLDAIQSAGLLCEMLSEEVLSEELSEPVLPSLSTGGSAARPEDDRSDPTSPVGEVGGSASVANQGAEPTATDSARSDNPYRQPEAELSISRGVRGLVLVPPRKLSGGAGLAWIQEGYGYFKQTPWTWIAMITLGMVIMMVTVAIGAVMVTAFAPLAVLFMIAFYLFTPVLTVGFILACYELHQGKKFGVEMLFAGFRNNLSGLIGLGILYTVLSAVVMVVAMGGMMVLMGSQANLMMGQGSFMMMGQGSFMMLLLYNLFVIGLSIPIIMTIWFAPALVAIHGVSPLKAMGMSIKGCLRNIWPFTLYGLVGIVLAILASIPLGLGWLVLIPVMTGSIFAAYRQIFTEESDTPAVVAALSA